MYISSYLIINQLVNPLFAEISLSFATKYYIYILLHFTFCYKNHKQWEEQYYS